MLDEAMSFERLYAIRKHQSRVGAKKKISVSPAEEQAPKAIETPVVEIKPAQESISVVSEPETPKIIAPLNSLFADNKNKPNDLVALAKQRMAEKKQQEESGNSNDNKVEDSVPNAEITQEVFDIVWQAYLKELEDTGNRRISSFIKERSYEIVAGDRVKITLFSNLEKEMFEAERLSVLPFFRSRLKNNTFEFEYEISNNNPTENRLLTAEQKFKLMAQKNPLLSDLQRIFELQIEY